MQPDTFTILLVDDRPENLLSLEEILARDGRTFIRATSGNEALRHVLRNDQIGLVMLDVQMPEMDGFEVARLLRSNPRTRDLLIIFVTAISKDEQYVLKGFDEGAVDYLQKPLDVNLTRAKVAVFERLYFAQRNLKRAVAEREQINKQLEKFVYVVAHDLKSPLTGIITLLSILEMSNENRPLRQREVQDYIDELKTAGHHLSGMITSILDYSRQSLQQQTIEEVDVLELLQETAHLLFPPRHIRIHILEPMPVLRTRKLKLQQVFQNLLSNAIKYNDKPVGEIEVGCRDQGDFWEFYVKDNGPGLSDDDQQRLFKLFQPGTRPAGAATNVAQLESSTGVGLNILKMLVEEQGGRIRVESQPGAGTLVSFEWKKTAG